MRLGRVSPLRWCATALNERYSAIPLFDGRAEANAVELREQVRTKNVTGRA